MNNAVKIIGIIVIGIVSLLTFFTIVTPEIGCVLIYALVTDRDVIL